MRTRRRGQGPLAGPSGAVVCCALAAAGLLAGARSARGNDIPLQAQVVLGRQIQAITRSPAEVDTYWLFAFPSQVIRVRLDGLGTDSVGATELEALTIDQPLSDVSGLAYHEALDRFFLTTRGGDLRRLRRQGGGLVTEAQSRVAGELVTPPVSGDLALEGITVDADGNLAVVDSGHLVVLTPDGSILRSRGLGQGAGPSATIGVDLHPGSERLGLVGLGAAELFVFANEAPLASRLLSGGLVLGAEADFAWDPLHGSLLLTDRQSAGGPDLFVFSLTACPRRFVVTSTRNAGSGSLREVLEEANRNIVADVITFTTGLFPPFIRLGSDLPALEEGFVEIDGDTDGDGVPDLMITTGSPATASRGLSVPSSGNVIRGLSFSGFSGFGIILRGDRNRVERCHIGPGLDGIATDRAGLHGIHVLARASDNTVSDCIISGWNGDGIRIEGRSRRTAVKGCFIGLDVRGGMSVGNGGAGIRVIYSTGHRLGGGLPGQGNVIGLCDDAGIQIEWRTEPGPSSDIDIQGNIIGADPTGTRPRPNGLDGIRIRDCTDIRIGGPSAGDGNRILFHDEFAVLVLGPETQRISTRRNILFRNAKPGIGRFFGAEFHTDVAVLDNPSSYSLGGFLTTVTGVGLVGATVEVFSTGDPPRADGVGDAAQFLGAGVVDDLGSFAIDVPGPLTLGATITAIQTDRDGGSSGFSQNQIVPDLPQFSTLAGNVNAGAGPLADVLRVNGSPGDEGRNLYLAIGQAIEAAVENPPSRVGQRSPYALYVWRGLPRGEDVTPLPFGIGRLVFPGPFAVGTEPQPRLVLNNIGFPGTLGVPDVPSSPAPSVAMRLPGGVRVPSVWVVQGIIRDDATATGLRAAVTNGIVLFIGG